MHKIKSSVLAVLLLPALGAGQVQATTWDFDGVISECNALACGIIGIGVGQTIEGFLRAAPDNSGPNSTFGIVDITDYAIAAQGVAVGPADSTIVSASVSTDSAGNPVAGSIVFFGEFDGGIFGTVPLDVTIDFSNNTWLVETTTLGIGVVASGPGTWTLESDGDDLARIEDNCTLVFNPAQRDTDADGFGNDCDADFDQSCFINFSDLNVMSANFFTAGDLITDLNGDGQTNFGDLFIMRQMFFAAPGPGAPGNICEI